MNLKENAISQLASAGRGVLQLLDEYDENTINEKPDASVWSAGQIAEHLTKSSLSIAKIMSIEGTEVNRAPDMHVPELSAMMENREVKVQSAAFLLPGNSTVFKDTVDQFSNSLQKLIDAASNTNLNVIPDNVLFPKIGAMTKLEFIFFAGFHIRRHTLQMQSLKSHTN